MQKSLTNFHQLFYFINPLSGNPTKWSDILKQFVGNLPTNCLSVFDHFAGLTLKGLRFTKIHTRELWNVYFFYILPLTFFLRLDKACDKLNFGKKKSKNLKGKDSFHTIWKHQKTNTHAKVWFQQSCFLTLLKSKLGMGVGFLMFSGSKKMKHWPNIGIFKLYL